MSQVLYDRLGQVWEAQKALLEATANRTLSGEEKSALAKMDTEIEELEYSIRAQEKGEERRAKYDGPGEPVVSTRGVEVHPLTPDGPAGTAALRGAVRSAGSGSDFVHAHEYERAFDNYLRRGIDKLGAEQRGLMEKYEVRDQSVGTTTAGGYTVPQGFLEKLTDALKLYGGMLEASNVIDTESGALLPWPTADDTGNVGAILSENVAATTQDITFGQKSLSAFMYTSKIIKVSLQLLNDSAFDLNAWLPDKFAQRIGRAINAHFTNGTGGGTQPAGLVPGLTVGRTGAVGSTVSLGSTAAVAIAELIELEHSVDPAYRANAAYMLADSSVKVMRKIVDTTGRPLWEQSLQRGVPSNFDGYPVYINQDMPVMAANAKSIAFGDFKQAYVIRRVQGVSTLRLAERYADALQVGFMSFARYDGVVDDVNAAKLFQNSAT